MKRFKLVLKGILLWVTLFTNIIFVSGVDSIYDAGYLYQQSLYVLYYAMLVIGLYLKKSTKR